MAGKPKSARVELNDEDVRQLILDGFSIKDVGRYYGVSGQTVRRFYDKMVDPPIICSGIGPMVPEEIPTVIGDPYIAVALRMLRAKEDLKDIYAVTGIPYATLRTLSVK